MKGGMMSSKFWSVPVLAIALVIASLAQAHNVGPSLPQIGSPIDESKRVTFYGNTRPEANAANDRGRVSDSLPLPHIQMLLHRPKAQEQALENLIDSQNDRMSPSYHKWLSASEFGRRFGVATQDVNTISSWLARHGFQVNGVLPNRMIVDFSGTAGQVREAFHTEIHNLKVNGKSHIANMSDPQMPAALAPAITGIVSLHDFRPKPQYTYGSNCYPLDSSGAANSTCYSMVPADLATIYNFTPAFNANIVGQNQTIALMEASDVYSTNDWTTFRQEFDLSGYGGTFTTVHPTGLNNCSDPGVNSNAEAEAILDAEWSSAAAPGAKIELDSCENVGTTPAILIALENRTNVTDPLAIISISYGECETDDGSAMNATINNTYEQAVSEGFSVFVAAGDRGSSACNEVNNPLPVDGIGISAYASSQYAVSVGGTDFEDTYEGINVTYWNSNNTSYYGSAKSYIPEIPWNNTCGSVLLALYYAPYSGITYGTEGFCNSSAPFKGLLAGGGGPSGCATGAPSVPGVVSGTCAGWAKPSWQQNFLGVPNDSVRDVPDVSLFAAGNPGVWGHYYIFCDSRAASCSGLPNTWSYGDGTSFAAPIFAGIQALINKKSGGAQGNPASTYYEIAAAEYGGSLLTKCASSNGNAVDSSCIFYDVTQGDKDVPCAPYVTPGSTLYNCFLPSGTVGVLSTSISSYQPAYRAATGWDFGTGIGTVNVANLVNALP